MRFTLQSKMLLSLSHLSVVEVVTAALMALATSLLHKEEHADWAGIRLDTATSHAEKDGYGIALGAVAKDAGSGKLFNEKRC